jgi:peptide/nickel transport system ATP-binding protein
MATVNPPAQPLVAIRDLQVSFAGVPALRGIDLTVAPGEAVGLVGESGSGKSVTWLAALSLLPAKARVTGSVLLAGEELIGAPPARLDDVRGGRVAMIFQDPASALNPVLTVGRQIGEALALHAGLSGGALRAEAKRLMELVGIPDAGRRLDAYPHEFSGGQNQRVMIAMALAGKPDLLVADEPTTALDVTIQAQILDLLRAVRREFGMALVLISHDLGVIAETCERVAVMYAGRIVEEAPVAPLFGEALHPYTRGLVGSLPPLDGPRRRLTSIPGTVPDPRHLPAGCAFAPRCPVASGGCRETDPRLAAAGEAHRVACLHPGAEAAVPVPAAAAILPATTAAPAMALTS